MNQIISVSDAVAIGLVFSRVIAFFITFPLINSSFIPLNVRVMLVIAFSFFIFSLSSMKVPDIENISLTLLALLILKELLIGFLLSVITQIFIAIFSYTAEIIGYFMGLTIANLFDPTFGQISVLDRFFILLFYLLFFVTGGYQFLIVGLIKSFEIIPLFDIHINTGIFEYILLKSSLLFLLALKMSFPFVAILLLLNVALALVNRLIPQINVFIVGLPMQIFLGLLSLAIGASVVIYYGNHIMEMFVKIFLKAVKIVGG